MWDARSGRMRNVCRMWNVRHMRNVGSMRNVGCRKRGQVWNAEMESRKGVVMDTDMAPRDESQVRGTTEQGRVRNFLPMTFLYPFGWVTGM